MNFLSTLKIADVTDMSNRKDKTAIAMEAFTAKLDVQLAYAKAEKEGTVYVPERTRKEPAKREPLDLRWYKRVGEEYVTVVKVGRQPLTKDGKPIAYVAGKTIDEVIQFFTAFRKAAQDRDPGLVKMILEEKAAQEKGNKPAETAPAAQPAKGKAAKA